IPTADGVDDPDRRDDLEAAALYDLLENTVVPRFYDRTDGLPVQWLANVRHTLATLGPKVQATRMVRDYIGQLYLPTAENNRRLGAAGGAGAGAVAGWEPPGRGAWPAVGGGHGGAEGVQGVVQVGGPGTARGFVHLGDLAPEDVQVQMVHGRVGEDDQIDDFE